MKCCSRILQGIFPLLVAAFSLLAPAKLPAFQQPSLAISSGETTNANYAASSAIAKIFNRKSADYGKRFSVTPTAGSVATIDNVVQGKTPFGVAQGDMLQRAVNGIEPWKGTPQKQLRAVLALHVEALTIVAARDSEIQRMSNLKNKRVNIGAPGSSDHEYATILLEKTGIKPDEMTLSEYPSALAAEHLQKNDIDAYIYTLGHPNLSVLEASTGKTKVRLIPIDKSLIDQVTSRNPLLIPVMIPTSFYPGLEQQGNVQSVGVRAVLFTRADMAEDTVYSLVKEVMTNFDLLKRQHPVLQDLAPAEVGNIKVLPLHPGAARYFREAGFAP